MYFISVPGLLSCSNKNTRTGQLCHWNYSLVTLLWARDSITRFSPPTMGQTSSTIPKEWQKRNETLTWILGHCFILSSWGIVFVTTTASKQALLIRDIAGPEKIPWVKMAYTLVAPADTSLWGRKKKDENLTSIKVSTVCLGNRLPLIFPIQSVTDQLFIQYKVKLGFLFIMDEIRSVIIRSVIKELHYLVKLHVQVIWSIR